ncbi:MAG: guanylate kinase [Armatimonadetes bacterium]|nr:guanylate kinase [Armatimonadota bacterium]
MSQSQARLFVLDGPAATGKSVITQRLLEEESELSFCPRVTSRPRRPDEDEPFEYRFISEADFDRLLEDGQFAAYRVFLHGFSYGLPRGDLEELLSRGDVLTIVDTGTAEQVKAQFPESVTILVISPMEEIEKRLRALGIYGAEQIQERVQNAGNILSLAPYYDFVVVNRQGRLEHVLQQVRHILRTP